jgi:hypothetical protein
MLMGSTVADLCFHWDVKEGALVWKSLS